MESIERIGNWIADEYRKNGLKWTARFGYTGIVVSPILAAYGAIKAYKAIEKRKKELGVDELPLKESAKIVAENAAAPVATTVLTLVSTAKVQNELCKANDALTTAIVLGENKYRELKEAQKEVVGEEKAEEIQNKATEKALEKIDTSGLTCDPVRGIYPCLDTMLGQVIKETSETKINAAMDRVRYNTFYGQNVTLSEFIEDCGGRACMIGDEYVWPASRESSDYKVEVDFMKDEYGMPMLVIKYPYSSGLTSINDI